MSYHFNQSTRYGALGAALCPEHFKTDGDKCVPADERGCWLKAQQLLEHGVPGPVVQNGFQLCLQNIASLPLRQTRRMRPLRGLGQLTMDPQTLAALQACSQNCEKQYGVASGAPNVIALTSCFASCNVQYPPTVAVPGGGAVTPPALPPGPTVPPVEPVPPVVPGVTEPPPPAPPGPGTTPGAKPPIKAGGGDMKMWVIGGAVAVAAVGAFLYFKK